MQNSKKIKILITVPSLECGGLEKNVAFLVNQLCTNKFDITLAIVNNRRPFFSISNPEVKIIDLAAPGARKAMPLLIRLANEIQPDILLSAANHLNLLCTIHKKKFPVNMKLVARESSIVSQNVKNGKFAWLYSKLLKHYYKKSDLIICQSGYMKADLKNNYHIKEATLKVINNPVQLPHPPKKNIPNYPVFISVGRLRPEKGMNDLLRAVSKLKQGFRLHIVGDGPERKQLEALSHQLHINKKLIFHGDCTNPFSIGEMPGLFLLCSHYEGFPNAVLEAGALGIPVIAYDAPGGISEIIRNEKNGFLVSPRDPVLFAQTIQRALQFPFNTQAIRNYTLSKYSPDAIIKEWEITFEKLLT